MFSILSVLPTVSLWPMGLVDEAALGPGFTGSLIEPVTSCFEYIF